MRVFSLLFAVALCFGSVQVDARELHPGTESAVTETAAVINDMAELKVPARVKATLDEAFKIAVRALAESGHRQDAVRLEREWKALAPKFFGPVEGLGDHRPLSQWLARTYSMLEQRLGSARMKDLHLDDIYVVNYAIPVVIDPTGPWNKREYGRHFIPLSGVVTYWSTLKECMSRFNSYRLCDRAAEFLEKRVMADVGPKLSDYVYMRFNTRGFRGEFAVTRDELVYRYSRELVAIR